MFHMTQRVAWHENQWDGTICSHPTENSFCIALDRIRLERQDAKEIQEASRSWGKLDPDDIPPCKAEAGGFMNKEDWTRLIRHPYKDLPKTRDTHGHLKDTVLKVPPYTSFAVPFAWMLNDNQKAIDNSLPEPLPEDEKAPFSSPWVFGKDRQEALSELMFGRLSNEKSLVFFYCKEGTPLGDLTSRLVVGVGRILSVGKTGYYESTKKATYPLWDRKISHSIRPNGHDGFLLPYHEYIKPTGNAEEDARRFELLKEIAVIPDTNQIRSFSYASELASPDVALSTLVRCLEAVRKIREHGIAEGPWEKREEWLNQQIALVWKERGAFPGTGSALEALGMRLGTALFMELLSSNVLTSKDNPWQVIDQIFRGKKKPPQKAYEADLKAVQKTWIGLSEERRNLLLLLSRFDLTTPQAKRWFDETKRDKATRFNVVDAVILSNPYSISEADLGDNREPPVSIGVVDRGLLPDDTIRVQHPVPESSAVGSINDPRRVRAALVAVLRNASDRGDALLSITESLERLAKLDLSHPCDIGADWVTANHETLAGTVELLTIQRSTGKGVGIAAVQLTALQHQEKSLKKILSARSAKELDSVKADWSDLLQKAISEAKSTYDKKNPRHVEALKEQTAALEKITTRKLTALVGKAGTGKTSVLGALVQCEKLVNDGILLLAPTGKARVRLGRVAGAEAMTIAQFLYGLGRYDGVRQRPLFEGKEKYRKEKTVVIDECSMLTMDTLYAVLESLDLGHVQRLILVGDPNQLPPIGVGRPFADFVGHLDRLSSEDSVDSKLLAGALARLTVEVRAFAGAPSDTLRLASWFTAEPQPIDADRVLSDLELGGQFNDLEICFWRTPQELHTRLLEQFQKHLGLSNAEDAAGFNCALGCNDKGLVVFENPDGAENFQILSPVRMHPHGVYDLNRWIQRQYRKKELEAGRQLWGVALGDEEIVIRDKVIQLSNERRVGYHWSEKSKVEEYLANGEIGMAASSKSGFLNVVFAGRANITFGYSNRYDFRGGKGPIELAYALTIHKAQGSEFRKVFVVLPKNSRLISRELLYTALTRAKERLILLMEGDNIGSLYDLTRPEQSETARRNTNLFETEGAVRENSAVSPYADHLIHRTDKGHMVRSKSELVIANMLHHMNIPYEYERQLEGTKEPGKLRPDFTFIDASGEPIIWEHLGMLGRADYAKSWEWKKAWYQKNAFVEGKNLFTTTENDRSGLDSAIIRDTVNSIKVLL